jgi:rubrerythrin
VDVNEFLKDPRSRRTFFRGAGVTFVGGSAVFLAACGDDNGGSGAGSPDTTSTSAGGGKGDVAILNSALDLEHTAVAAYTAGAALLKGAVLDVGKQFLAQEKEHVAGLQQAIKQLGGTPNQPKASYDFPTLSNQMDVLKFANDLEHTAVAAYVGAIPKLTDPKLRGTAAAIVTNEAEHIAVLLGALGRDPFGQVPDAFVTGTKS